MAGRDRIPASVARELRKEAGFGCCVCGHPIIEYHHIVPWEEEQHFRVEDMIALCPNHHRDASTRGSIPRDRQYALKGDPANIRAGYSHGRLTLPSNEPVVLAGSNLLVGEGPFLRIDRTSVLTVHYQGQAILLSLPLYDRDGNLLAAIDDNEWISGDHSPWDIVFQHRLLVIRSKHHLVSLSIDARKEPVTLQGHLWFNGERIRIDRNRINAADGRATMQSCRLHGFGIGLDSARAGFGILRLDEWFGGRGDSRPLGSDLDPYDPCWCGRNEKYKWCHGARGLRPFL